MNFRARVSHHHALTLSCCGTYLQGGNGVGVHDDSTGVYPAPPPTAIISAPGFLVHVVGSGMGTRLRGFLHADRGAHHAMLAHTGARPARILSIEKGSEAAIVSRERSSTRRWQFRDSEQEEKECGRNRSLQRTSRLISTISS